MSLAILADGSLFKVGDGASAEVFATVPECHDIQAPQVKYDMVDVTSHDSAGGFREWLPGLADGENASAQFFYVPSNSVHKSIRDANINKTKKNFRIVFTGDTDNQIEFAGYAMSFQPSAKMGDALRSSLSVRMTGQPTWGTASA